MSEGMFWSEDDEELSTCSDSEAGVLDRVQGGAAHVRRFGSPRWGCSCSDSEAAYPERVNLRRNCTPELDGDGPGWPKRGSRYHICGLNWIQGGSHR